VLVYIQSAIAVASALLGLYRGVRELLRDAQRTVASGDEVRQAELKAAFARLAAAKTAGEISDAQDVIVKLKLRP